MTRWKHSSGKANEPNAISAGMLKHTASVIPPPLTELFNLSIHTSQLPRDWKVSHVVPISKQPGQSHTQTSGPYLYCLFWVKSRKAFSHANIWPSCWAPSTMKLSVGLPTKEMFFVHIDQQPIHDWLQQLEALHECMSDVQQFSWPFALHIEDCDGQWFSGGCGSLVVVSKEP